MKKTSRKAYSLVELVVVILIIAILAAAVFLGGATVIQQSRESAVKTDLSNFASYVQDMLYDNPEMQYNSGTYGVNEGYTFDANDTKYQQFAIAGSSSLSTAANVAENAQPTGIVAKADSVTVASLPILNKLNERYLTADFKLDGSTKDVWGNPYCYSYDMSASKATGDPASCIIVINSLGKNSLDETSDASKTAASHVANNAIETLGDKDKEDTTTVNESRMSATDVVSNLAGTGDDYGVVVCMIDGAVSTAYYGF